VTAAPRRAIVIGAGPAGLATAILLRQGGLEAVVYERDTDDLTGGIALTLWPNAFKALEILGAAYAARRHSAPSEGLAIRSSAGAMLQFVSRAAMEARCGGTGWALLRHDLMRILRNLLPDGTIRFGARFVGFQTVPDCVVARFANGLEAEGTLLVGADGIRSAVRTALLSGDDLRYLGYTVARGVTVYPTCNSPGQLSIGRGQQFGLFPMTHQRLYWFAAINAPEGNPMHASDRLPELVERFGNWHEPICDVLRATDPGNLLFTDIYDRRPLRHWGKGAAILVGDAAHPGAPALGQGTSQAFEDAVVLADCLANDADTLTALRAYEVRRRRRANALITQSRWMGRLGQWRHPVLCSLRDRTIKAVPQDRQLRQLQRIFAFEVPIRSNPRDIK
jgi:2-polyprenyl-6-methoxyphenol hydroxylase-like FAD-dependent oxidoreductase